MSDELKAALNKLEWAAVSAEAAASHAAEFPNGVAEQVKEASAERLASARARVEALCKPPEGWRLVPAEPTGEMVKAGIAANDGIVSDIYRAMLAAAPPPPGTAPKREALSEEQIDALWRAPMSHDEGARAQCAYCKRYTLDLRAFGDDPPKCECGRDDGWSGSFPKPAPDAQWSGARPQPAGTAPVERPAEWRGPSERWSTGDRVDIELGDGSILRDCIPQADGDLWWSGAGIGERFIDPECAAIERWRITPEELRND